MHILLLLRRLQKVSVSLSVSSAHHYQDKPWGICNAERELSDGQQEKKPHKNIKHILTPLAAQHQNNHLFNAHTSVKRKPQAKRCTHLC